MGFGHPEGSIHRFQVHVGRIEKVGESEREESAVVEGALSAFGGVPCACSGNGGIFKVVRDNSTVGE